MPRQNEFELLDTLIKRDRFFRWVHFWIIHIGWFILLWIAFSFAWSLPPLKWIYGTSPLGQAFTFVAVLLQCLYGVLWEFRYMFKYMIAIVDQNQVIMANKILPKRGRIPFGFGFHPKYLWDLIDIKDPKTVVSLEEGTEETPEDRPEISPTLDYDLLFHTKFNHNVDIQHVISGQQITVDVAVATVMSTVNTMIRAIFPYLTSKEARENISQITELCMLILEGRSTAFVRLGILVHVLSKFQLDEYSNPKGRKNLLLTKLGIIKAVTNSTTSSYRGLGIQNKKCSILEYFGLQVEYLQITRVRFTQEVENSRNLGAGFDAFQGGLYKLIGVDPTWNDEKKAEYFRNYSVTHKEQYEQVARRAMALAKASDYKVSDDTKHLDIVGFNNVNSMIQLFDAIGKVGGGIIKALKE